MCAGALIANSVCHHFRPPLHGWRPSKGGRKIIIVLSPPILELRPSGDKDGATFGSSSLLISCPAPRPLVWRPRDKLTSCWEGQCLATCSPLCQTLACCAFICNVSKPVGPVEGAKVLLNKDD